MRIFVSVKMTGKKKDRFFRHFLFPQASDTQPFILKNPSLKICQARIGSKIGDFQGNTRCLLLFKGVLIRFSSDAYSFNFLVLPDFA